MVYAGNALIWLRQVVLTEHNEEKTEEEMGERLMKAQTRRPKFKPGDFVFWLLEPVNADVIVRGGRIIQASVSGDKWTYLIEGLHAPIERVELDIYHSFNEASNCGLRLKGSILDEKTGSEMDTENFRRLARVASGW